MIIARVTFSPLLNTGFKYPLEECEGLWSGLAWLKLTLSVGVDRRADILLTADDWDRLSGGKAAGGWPRVGAETEG